MIFTHIRPGTILSVPEVVRDIDGVKRTVKDWEVKEIFPHHVLAEHNGIRKCFTASRLIELKLAIQDPKLEALKQEKNGSKATKINRTQYTGRKEVIPSSH